MKLKKFDEFQVKESKREEYNRKHLLENIPKFIEDSEKWYNAVGIATDFGRSEAEYSKVVAIYNNLDKKEEKIDKKDHMKDWKETSYKYWKDVIDKSNKLSISQRKFYNSILKTIKDTGKVSPKQYTELKRLEVGNFDTRR